MKVFGFCLFIFALSFCKSTEVKTDSGSSKTLVIPDEIPSNQYYKVITRSGLNLRAEPDINSKRLLTIPFLQAGEILQERTAFMELQNQHGHWLKIKYRNQEGYIFSGFVLLGDSVQHVNDMFERMQFKFYPWKTQPFDLSKEKVATRIPWVDGWQIIEVEKKADAICDYKKTFKNLIFVNERNRTQTTQILLEQYISDPRLMDRKIMISDGNYCHCCCKFHDIELHLARPDAIYSIPFYYGKQKAECGHWFAPESEARVTPSRFFYSIKQPICMQYLSENVMAPKLGEIQFADEKLLVIEKNGEYKMHDKIPKELKDEWDKAVLFTK